jgi:hypothetical protein
VASDDVEGRQMLRWMPTGEKRATAGMVRIRETSLIMVSNDPENERR